jgi:hypothetical protein
MVAIRLKLENTWWPPNGRRSARFNLRPIKSKLDALKVKNISKIQAVKQKFLNIQTSKI